MTADEIVTEITRRAWSFGVSVLLAPAAYVEVDGVKCGGFFCGEELKLAVGVDRDEEQWLGILLHEYSHLTQWAEDSAIWREDERVSGGTDDWLSGKPVRNAKHKIEVRRELEADCERRTIRLVKELQAPIDLEHYARAANSYIHFYNVMRDTRKWYRDGMGPYTRPDILAMCRPTLDRDFSKTPPKLYAALLTCV